MLNIKSFDMYRDGGTISIRCNLGGTQWSKYLHDHHMNSDEMSICLDGRFGKEPKIWFGYPESEGSVVIEEKELIDLILEKAQSFKQSQNHKIDKFLDFDVNVRDWKIKNILNDEKKV
jgi:hypothetical protein